MAVPTWLTGGISNEEFDLFGVHLKAGRAVKTTCSQEVRTVEELLEVELEAVQLGRAHGEELEETGTRAVPDEIVR